MLPRHSLVVDGWASSADPSPSNRVLDGIPLGWMGFRWAFPSDGVVPSSARESFVSRWPARETPCDPRQARPFHMQNPGVEPKGHVIGYQSHVVWPHRAAVCANPIGLLEVKVFCSKACQLHGPRLEPAVLTTDSESDEVESRRRHSCSVRDSSAALCGRWSSRESGVLGSLSTHCASEGFFALSKRIAERSVEHGVSRCHRLIAIFKVKSSSVAVCRREQDDRRSGRDVDGVDTIYKI